MHLSYVPWWQTLVVKVHVMACANGVRTGACTWYKYSTCQSQHAHWKKYAWTFSFYRLTDQSVTLIHLHAPKRFPHLLPAESPYPPIEAVVTRTLMGKLRFFNSNLTLFVCIDIRSIYQSLRSILSSLGSLETQTRPPEAVTASQPKWAFQLLKGSSNVKAFILFQ